MHVAVAILRVQDGLDYTGIIADFNVGSKSNGVDNKAFASEDSANNNQDSNVDQEEMTASTDSKAFKLILVTALTMYFFYRMQTV